MTALRSIGGFVALTAAVTIGARAAMLWRDVNNANGMLRVMRSMR